MKLNSEKILFLEKIDTLKIQELFSYWVEQYPQGGVLAFIAEQSIDAVDNLRTEANKENCTLIGAVFPELIVEGELKKQGVLLLHFKEMPSFCIVPLSNSISELDKETLTITASLDIDMDDDEQALFMIFDSMIPNIASFIDELYLKIGDVVSYMGVNAGSETFQPMNCLFDNNKFIGDAVLIMVIKQHHSAVLEHGYTSPDSSISATSTTGNRISSIDWRPAFDVYKELAYKHYGVKITKDNFYENAVHFPIGIVRMDGEMLVRIPVALDDDGSLYCVGEVPENSVLTLLKAVSPNSSKTIETIVRKIENQTEDTILTFYCAGRRMHLGDASLTELSLLKKRLSHKNIFGALSLGEIGGSKQGGYPLFHNAALINIPWV